MGFFGGLVMLVIKCDKGVKDWGYFIVGYGGFVDCFDLVVFFVFVFFYVVCFFWLLV